MSPLLLFVVLGFTLTLPAGAQQFPEPALYELLPANYQHPIARVCYTGEGICSIPTFIAPGTPCECRRANGAWVKGVCTH